MMRWLNPDQKRSAAGIDRSVDHIYESVVVTGDDNVVLVLNGHEFARVPIPQTAEEIHEVLFGPHQPRDSAVVGSWLRPDAGVLRPQPRHEMDDLAKWCTSDQAPLVRLVCGAGGQGKTFLATQLSEHLRSEGWMAGIVPMPPANWRALSFVDAAGVARESLRRDLRRLPELTAGLHAVAKTTTSTLLVVDYAENVTPVVSELINTIADVDGFAHMRILLLARSAGSWWRELTVEHRHHGWVDPTPFTLESLTQSLSADEISEIWREAVATFTDLATARGISTAPTRRTRRPPSAPSTTLHLYADALLQVVDPSARGGHDPMVRVLNHEHRQIAHAFRAQQVELDLSRRDWAVLTAILRPVTTYAEAVEAFASAPPLSDLDQSALRSIADVMHQLYPHDVGTYLWQAPRPDPLVDIHLRQMATDAPSDQDFVEGVSAICGGAWLGPALHAAKVLHRCWSSIEQKGRFASAHRRLEAVLRTLVRRWPGGYAPALTTLDPTTFAADIERAVVADSPDHVGLHIDEVEVLDQVLRSMESTFTRGRIAIAVSRRLAAAAECGEEAEPAAQDRYARELTILSLRLAESGEARQSLDAAEQAVAIRRKLAASDPRYRAPMAESLSDLSVRLNHLGLQDRSLLAAQEAVDVFRAVCSEHLWALPYLADALNALSIRLKSSNRQADSIAASSESVAICRRLANADDSCQSDLAMALNNHSLRLGAFGRTEQSLEAIEEAAGIYRALAERNPVHSTQLSRALHNLAVRWQEAGELGRSLGAIDEAVGIRRRIAANTSTRVSKADLAASLACRAVVLERLDRQHEGLASIREAADIYQTVVEPGRPAYHANFASALAVLAGMLERSGETVSALDMLQQCLAVRCGQVEQGDTAAVDALMDALAQVADMVERSSYSGPDVRKGERAVAAFRSVGAREVTLSRSLDCLARIAAAARQRDICIEVAEEAADRWEAMATADPASYRSGFRLSIQMLVQHKSRFNEPVDIHQLSERLGRIPQVEEGDRPKSRADGPSIHA